MATCPKCKQERFIIYRRYQGIKIKPARCINCIVRFPPRGVVNTGQEYLRYKPWIASRVLNHAWTLIAQTKKIDIWFCPFCRQSIRSKKEGTPSYAGCKSGQEFRPRIQWYVDILRLTAVLCPLCNEPADVVTLRRVIVKRPRKNYWPYTCSKCYGG